MASSCNGTRRRRFPSGGGERQPGGEDDEGEEDAGILHRRGGLSGRVGRQVYATSWYVGVDTERGRQHAAGGGVLAIIRHLACRCRHRKMRAAHAPSAAAGGPTCETCGDVSLFCAAWHAGLHIERGSAGGGLAAWERHRSGRNHHPRFRCACRCLCEFRGRMCGFASRAARAGGSAKQGGRPRSRAAEAGEKTPTRTKAVRTRRARSGAGSGLNRCASIC